MAASLAAAAPTSAARQGPVPICGPRGTSPFRSCVRLTKEEAFAACQALADADRVLVAVGALPEAGSLGDLFELLEDRLTGPAPAGPDQNGSRSA